MKAPLTLGLYGLGLVAVFGLSYGVAGVVAGSFAPPASVQHNEPHDGAES
ncbi:MAG: hypothetical protein ABWY30_01230 [Microterricola sp.]